MDNLKFRRILFVIGIIIILIGSIMFVYSIYTQNSTLQLLSIVLVLIAYLISTYVKRLQRQSREQSQSTEPSQSAEQK